MELRLDEIKGLMLLPKEIQYYIDDYSITEHRQRVLTQQGARKITINEEKLAKLIYVHPGEDWNKFDEKAKQFFLERVKFILSHLNELIESVAE